MDTSRPIIALDLPGAEAALDFVAKFDESLFVKVGMELFYAAGPSVITSSRTPGTMFSATSNSTTSPTPSRVRP